MSTPGSTGGNGPDQRSHAEEFVAVANAVVGGVGTVYTATESVAVAMLALGGVVLVWLVVLLGRRGDGR